MHSHSTFQNTIIDLRGRGYCEDFVLFGDDLLWVRDKSFIRGNNFSITECHSFAHPYGKNEDLVIFGILLLCHDIKGILMNHYSYSSGIPELITKKLSDMGFYTSKNLAWNYSILHDKTQKERTTDYQ